MADTLSLVAGTDGIVPNYEPDGVWHIWAMFEIFLGGIGSGKYVPKVRDYVVDTDTQQWFKVTSIDITTLIPVLEEITGAVKTDTLSKYDRLIGPATATPATTFRAYVDKSVIPNTLAIDARLTVSGNLCSFAKIFRESTIACTGTVVIAFYDSNGVLIGQNVPLEKVSADEADLVKVVKVCNTAQDLVDGEVLEVIFYSDTGAPVSITQVIVKETSFIRAADASEKYIKDITLETPFLSESNQQLIQYPINVPKSSFSLYGVVHYSDGTKKRYPVDGSKFQIFGLDNYVSTIVGQKTPLVLKYNLADNEIVYGATVTNEKFITKSYQAITQKADGAYSVKLFGYPVWIDAVNGYRLEWFLLNLDRNVFYRATPYVKFNENTAAFNPINYGANQKVSVSIDLNDVNGIYKKYVHTQTLEIMLLRPADDQSGSNWGVGFESNQNPQYGRDTFALMTFVNANLKYLNISQNETVFEAWLDKVMYRTKPLFDTDYETEAPVPNMFSIIIGSNEFEFHISKWHQDLTIENVALANTDSVFIKFFKRTTETDLILSVAGMNVWEALEMPPL